MIIGIDPGLNGAIAHLHPDGRLADIIDMPSIDHEVSAAHLYALILGLTHLNPTDRVAVLEDVQPMPKNGGIAGFSLGRSKGVVEGVLTAHGYWIVKVRPARWKRDMHATLPAGTTGTPAARSRAAKEITRRLATERWPGHAELFQRVKDADRAEAALLAEWHRLGHQA